VTGSAGAVPTQKHGEPHLGGSPDDLFMYIRPSEWASALANAFDISIDQASAMLADVSTADIESTGLNALAELWERSIETCAQYVLDRDLAVGMGLGYFRWQRRPGGRRILGGTELASSVGIWQVSKDLAAAVATLETDTLATSSDVQEEVAEGRPC
jgi:hypothetical protein